jgi:hypothetical protein
VTTPLELAAVSSPSARSLVSIDVATVHAAAVGNRNEPGFFRDY